MEITLIADIAGVLTVLGGIIGYIMAMNDKKKDINLKANAFIRDNDSELNLLPLCVVAYNVRTMLDLQRHGTNVTYPSKDIYLEYDKLDAKVKSEVLKQLNIILNIPSDPSWVNDCLELLICDAVKYNMSKKDNMYLYDEYKYYHDAISKYCDNIICNDMGYLSYRLLVVPYSYYKEPSIDLGQYNQQDKSYDDYITEYFWLNSGKTTTETTLLADNPCSPLDYANNGGKRTNENFTLYMIQFVKSFSEIVWVGVDSDIMDNTNCAIESDVITDVTYGDFYYMSLLNLYFAYYEITETQRNEYFSKLKNTTN